MLIAAAITLLVVRTPWNTVAVARAKGVRCDFHSVRHLASAPSLSGYREDRRLPGLAAGITASAGTSFSSSSRSAGCFPRSSRGSQASGRRSPSWPLLVAFGVRPVYAVATPIIGHLSAKIFGALAVE
jgi:lactate permease